MNIINKIISRLPFFRNRISRVNSNSNENKNFIFKNNYGTIDSLKSSCLLFLMNSEDTENLFI